MSNDIDPSTDWTTDDESASNGILGSATWARALVLGLALALLGGAIGWAIGSRDDKTDKLSTNDIGYLRDMFAHHEQAVDMCRLMLYKDDVDREIKSFAQEILIDQRYEQGIFSAVLVEAGLDTPDPDGMAMGWMGSPVPVAEMAGMATEAQMKALRAAKGDEAEALFIGLMNEHHLGGMHMSDHESRHGKYRLVKNFAKVSMKNQGGEVRDLEGYRKRHGLPLVEGFKDPLTDPRLNPVGAGD